MDAETILAEMKKLRGKDPETDHDQADKLLLDLINHLSEKHKQQPIIRQIIDTYTALTKWYG